MESKLDTLFPLITAEINQLDASSIGKERQEALNVLVDYITAQLAKEGKVRLNFICTHNSRRSHLAQIWARCMAYHFGIDEVYTYSGGTEATAMYSQVKETLIGQGFVIVALSEGSNTVYAVKYSPDHELIAFSKVYDHEYNPDENFAAVMTCSHADENCPFIPGADARIPITYDDPKEYDGTSLKVEKYLERSRQIATEMYYVMSHVKSSS